MKASPRDRRSWVFAVALAMILGGLVGAQPAVAAADVWAWQNPLPQGNNVTSVSCPAANVCKAVGDGGVVCSQDGARPTLVSIDPVDPRSPLPTEFELRISARRLPNSQTGAPMAGANPIEGPVRVFLASATGEESATISKCTQRGAGTLVCNLGR